MKNLHKLLVCVTLNLFCTVAIAAAAAVAPAPGSGVDYIQHVRLLLQQIIDVNIQYGDKFHEKVSESSLKNQTPNTTLLLCSDSRVDSSAINDTPTGKVFVVRNIGNQLITADGSVEYGVQNLNTPLLLIVGHSECGAVKAAMGSFDQAVPSLKKELSTIKVDKSKSLNDNIIGNINNQVDAAMNEFSDRIKKGELAVIGMFYDMHNNFHFGNGRLVIVNINNQTDPKAIDNSPYLKGLKNLTTVGMIRQRI